MIAVSIRFFISVRIGHSSDKLQTFRLKNVFAEPVVAPLAPEFRPLVREIYECILQKLKTRDVDQKCKERAIICMGQIIYNLGDFLETEMAICLPIILGSLHDEVTHISAVKALIMIIESPLRVNITAFLVFIKSFFISSPIHV